MPDSSRVCRTFARGERVAKYNRLVVFEHDAGLPYGQLTISLARPSDHTRNSPPETAEALYRMEPTVREERA